MQTFCVDFRDWLATARVKMGVTSFHSPSLFTLEIISKKGLHVVQDADILRGFLSFALRILIPRRILVVTSHSRPQRPPFLLVTWSASNPKDEDVTSAAIFCMPWLAIEINRRFLQPRSQGLLRGCVCS